MVQRMKLWTRLLALSLLLSMASVAYAQEERETVTLSIKGMT